MKYIKYDRIFVESSLLECYPEVYSIVGQYNAQKIFFFLQLTLKVSNQQTLYVFFVETPMNRKSYSCKNNLFTLWYSYWNIIEAFTQCSSTLTFFRWCLHSCWAEWPNTALCKTVFPHLIILYISYKKKKKKKNKKRKEKNSTFFYTIRTIRTQAKSK